MILRKVQDNDTVELDLQECAEGVRLIAYRNHEIYDLLTITLDGVIFENLLNEQLGLPVNIEGELKIIERV